MFYQCKKCNYEFENKVIEHPHNMYSKIKYAAYGCPICLKAAAMPKICPKCNSNDVIQIIK